MMKGEIVNLLNEATCYIDLGINIDIQAFLKGANQIDQYTVKAEGTAYMINIKLKDSIMMRKQYPEWDVQTRIPVFGHAI